MTAIVAVGIVSLCILIFGMWAEIDTLCGAGIAGILLVLVAAIFVAASKDGAEHDRLMRQCMADGNPEYKCVSMLRGPDTNTVVVPMPIVVPH